MKIVRIDSFFLGMGSGLAQDCVQGVAPQLGRPSLARASR